MNLKLRIDYEISYSFYSVSKGFSWHWVEAHKGRHHNWKGPAVGGTLAGHWDANNADKSYGNTSESGHQRAPLFDWESSWMPLDSLHMEQLEHGQQRVQEVTTTLGQTAFLHCRVRYLADRRVSFEF